MSPIVYYHEHFQTYALVVRLTLFRVCCCVVEDGACMHGLRGAIGTLASNTARTASASCGLRSCCAHAPLSESVVSARIYMASRGIKEEKQWLA